MKLTYGLFVLSCLCMPMFGCVIEAPVNEKDDPPTGLACNLDASLCSADQICVVIDRCGSSCDDDGSACPDVCVEVFGCVSPNADNAPCRPENDQCETGLSCQQDVEAPCVSSMCDGGICTDDCVPVFTCQPRIARHCDPAMGDTQCNAGEVCGIESFVGPGCAPDGGCPAVEPEPVFACVTPLLEGQQCDRMRTFYGYDQCGAGLVCTSASNPCVEVCDDEGECEFLCEPTPLPTCEPEPVRNCDPAMGDTQCGDGEVCGIESFVGHDCTPDGGCPDVEPTPVFACVVPLLEGQQCDRIRTDYGFDQCGAGLVCTSDSNPCVEICDEDGECEFLCEPTPLPTCEPEPVRNCDPAMGDTQCDDGEVCGIESFVGPDCTPDGDCPAVEREPVFTCLTPLSEGEQCDPVTTAFGFDQCAEGLVCTSDSNPCVEICDEDGECEFLCEPTPMPTCELESAN